MSKDDASLRKRIERMEMRIEALSQNLQVLLSKDIGDFDNLATHIHYHIYNASGSIGGLFKKVRFRVLKQGLLRVAERGLSISQGGVLDPTVAELRVLRIADSGSATAETQEVAQDNLTHQLNDEPAGSYGWYTDLRDSLVGTATYEKHFFLPRGLLNCFLGALQRVYTRVHASGELLMTVSGVSSYQVADMQVCRLSAIRPTEREPLVTQSLGGTWFASCRVAPMPGEQYALVWRNREQELGDGDVSWIDAAAEPDAPIAESIIAPPESLDLFLRDQR